MEVLYRTLKDFFQSVGLPLEQDMGITVHRLQGLHGSTPMKSPVFRTNYYAFLLITKGKSSYYIDHNHYDLARFSFYFTNPGHLKAFEIKEMIEGYMLTFSQEYITGLLNGDFLRQFPFLVHETTPVMRLSPAKLSDLANLFEQMLTEYESISVYKSDILSKHLAILLLKTKELLMTNKMPYKSVNRSSEIVTRFKEIINSNFKELSEEKVTKILLVKEIADILNVHPNHLTNTIKNSTGKSASEWINERRLSESKIYLSNSSKSISEIAFGLGFHDSAHFAKFFKKNTSCSPSFYRANHNL